MVAETFNFGGYALPAIPDPESPVPWGLRLGYAWKALRGQVHIMGPIDVSHVKTDQYMEGRLRVYLSKNEAERYRLNTAPVKN